MKTSLTSIAFALLGISHAAAAQTFTYPNGYSLWAPMDSRIKYVGFAALVDASDVEIARVPVLNIFVPKLAVSFPAQATNVSVAKLRLGWTQIGVTAGVSDLDGAYSPGYKLTPPFAVPAGATTKVEYNTITGGIVATVTVPPVPVADTAPPTVSIIAPGAGATFVGTNALTAVASDDVGVVGLQFQIDGANFSAEITAPPYTTIWNSTTVADGAHTVSAVARDAAGNRATSAAVSVKVSNAPPPPPPPPPPTPPPSGESPDGSTIPPLTEIVQVDAAGTVFTWKQVGTHAFVNGTDSGGSGFDQILYKTKIIYAHQSGDGWWLWRGSWAKIAGTP